MPRSLAARGIFPLMIPTEAAGVIHGRWLFAGLCGSVVLALVAWVNPGASAAPPATAATYRVVVPGVASDGPRDFSPSGMPVSIVTVTGRGVSVALSVEVAATESDRARGLMYRPWLTDGQGMLFLFPQPATAGFWMENTVIPLDIAFIDGAGRVVSIRHGLPLDLTVLYPAGPYAAALEVNAGWFERSGIGANAFVQLPATLPLPR